MSNYCATNYSLPAAAAGSVEPVSKDAAGRLPALLPPALVTGYAGRVSTFYNDTQATYSETYEPVRQTSVGDVWRVESRFISDRWLHLAYSFKGNQISFPDGGIGMFEQGDLPLLFDPLVERQYGLAVLASNPAVGMVKVGGQALVYGSNKDSSVGIVRHHVDLS